MSKTKKELEAELKELKAQLEQQPETQTGGSGSALSDILVEHQRQMTRLYNGYHKMAEELRQLLINNAEAAKNSTNEIRATIRKARRQ